MQPTGQRKTRRGDFGDDDLVIRTELVGGVGSMVVFSDGYIGDAECRSTNNDCGRLCGHMMEERSKDFEETS